MAEQVELFLRLFSLVPIQAVYVLIGAGAALENILPPVPSDVMVVLGGVLADRGVVRPAPVFFCAWGSNVVLAVGVYGMSRRYGRDVFSRRWAHWLLRPHQLAQLDAFYRRFGIGAIFVSRFLPVFRVLVPAFAGVSGVGFFRTTIPVATASALWYAVLVGAGIFASRNVPRIIGVLGHVNGWLLGAATLGLVAIGVWWWRSRHPREPQSDRGES